MEMKMHTEMTQSSNALPTFFRIHALQARSSRSGYEEAGFHRAIHARQLVTGDVDDDALDQLDHILRESHDGRREHVELASGDAPAVHGLVPSRRKSTFLRGVQAAIEEGRV
jgi:hypothetical protein